MIPCTRCGSNGFLNLHQIKDESVLSGGHHLILDWIALNDNHDVQVCDCCGDGEVDWYGEPGEHYGDDDPPGLGGPYAYNGGLCECD